MTNEEKKERIRQRIRAAVALENSAPEPDNAKYPRIQIYTRVSTDDLAQKSSVELQQEYYSNLITKYPKWNLEHICSKKEKSATNTQKEEVLQETMDDAVKRPLTLQPGQ